MGQPESLEVPSWKLTTYAKKILGPTFVRPVTMWVPFLPTKLSSKSYVSFSHICFIDTLWQKFFIIKYLLNFLTFFTYDKQTQIYTFHHSKEKPFSFG